MPAWGAILSQIHDRIRPSNTIFFNVQRTRIHYYTRDLRTATIGLVHRRSF